MFIDALKKQCPMPVIMAKKEIDNGENEITVLVDNEIAVENLKRLANESNFNATVEKDGENFKVIMNKTNAAAALNNKPEKNMSIKDFSFNCSGGYAVFIGKNFVGDGDFELGHNLMKMALYTLSQSENVPSAVLFMNSGVKLVSDDDEQIADSVKELINKGCKVLVCGTCLNYYALTDKLKVGTISNMYDILGEMQNSSKVITL